MNKLCILIVLLMPTLTEQKAVRQPRVLPPGPIPDECCQVFCPPKDICVCCFVDYEYFNGVSRVRSNGVPDSLKQKHSIAKREMESIDFDQNIDLIG